MQHTLTLMRRIVEGGERLALGGEAGGPPWWGGLFGSAATAALLCCSCDEGGDWRVPADPQAIPPAVCIGGDVPKSAWATEPSGEAREQDGGTRPSEGPALGSPFPPWALYDFQPQSCGYRGVYGLNAFLGRVTVVNLWAGS